MKFRIADTFTDSLARLPVDAQKAVKTTAFDFQVNPANPGHKFHRLDRGKDPNFWSVRVSGDFRISVHKSESSLLLCHEDHHDHAYAWAERRKAETHPRTGAAQLVEVRETVKEIVVPVYVEEARPSQAATSAKKSAIKAGATKPAATRVRPATPATAPIFQSRTDDELLGYGVPTEWLADVKAATDETLLALVEHLPAEAAEALLELATVGKPRVAAPAVANADPFDHPDAQRRFRIMTNVEELERALEFPWEKWTIFLHPEQRQWVEREYSGSARVAGSAGTGKTIVAIHRAAHLARNNDAARVLLTTFSDTLANSLHTKLKRLLGNEPRLFERIDVCALPALGERLYRAHVGEPRLVSRAELREIRAAASGAVAEHRFSLHFLLTEWEQIVDAWHLESWEQYRDVARLGRKTRLAEPQRRILWSIFEKARIALAERKLVTTADLFHALASKVATLKKPLFDFVIIDESQDLTVQQLRFLAALGGDRSNALFFAGDLGQRIFQIAFSWKSLGVDVRGRSRTLRVNYRMSHQIRSQADRLLDPVLTDVDGNAEDRSDAVSVFNGSPPEIRTIDSESAEIDAVAAWLTERANQRLKPHKFGVFARTDAQLDRARAAVTKANLPFVVLDDRVATQAGKVSISTMHLAKGLEFRAAAVMGCDDEVIPLQSLIESVGDDSDLKEVYDTERHLLYVACTRARDHLVVTGAEPASEFLDDIAR